MDGDASGGPLIDRSSNPRFWTPAEVGVAAERDPRLSDAEIHWATHGVQAQNYHIFYAGAGQGLVHGMGRSDLDQTVPVG